MGQTQYIYIYIEYNPPTGGKTENELPTAITEHWGAFGSKPSRYLAKYIPLRRMHLNTGLEDKWTATNTNFMWVCINIGRPPKTPPDEEK